MVTRIIHKSNKKYEKDNPMTVSRGKVHDYLSLVLDYRTDKKVKITMFKYIEQMLKEISKDMIGLAVSPAANHLFKINSNSKYLDRH